MVNDDGGGIRCREMANPASPASQTTDERIPMPHPRRIEGYAIVSEDGMLANAAGIMPDELKFEADQRFFQLGLDGADVVVHGRYSHEQQPRSHLRLRLILTRQVLAIAPDPSNEKALFWNPAGASLEQALAALGVPDGSVAVIGGTDVFGMFLDRYDVFQLTRAPHVRLPGGRPVFPEVPAHTPEEVLVSHGLAPGERQLLDATKGLAVISWRRLSKSGGG
jgi:dihydrofolate reductase